ncbi:phage tail tape measure protein [Chitinimonas arctica]|uniref:Phage tail tape measure protein n=1 Tax=Chitinimonas arctica TaxID=2594795 RepID=A0A516SJT7_9NEIS|nr:phage tail tape measure protein [Chitinimonas arctica]QDQ28318.1 phage tail tape measure protein [Chitinimonas arctica]
MAREIALGLVIGGAVGASLGKAFAETKGKVADLQRRTQDAKLWHKVIGETRQLQREFNTLHRTGSAAAEGVRRKLDGNIATLRQAGIEVERLEQHYRRLGRTARGLELQAAGRQRIGAGMEAGKSAMADAGKFALGMAAPVMVSADYRAIVRDIAIKGGIARTAEEEKLSRGIVRASADSGMARNDVAQAVNVMVGGGMTRQQALAYAPDAAKFSIGQASEGTDTAKLIQALAQNAKIGDPEGMRKALNSIAYLGKAGSFESNDMARWFPELLAEMQKVGIVGQESISSLGAMLQVQMKTAGSADQAANNLKNWFSKIGSEETKKQYKDAGIDYEAKMREAIGKGWNTVEASFVLARAYVERIDPTKAKQLAEAAKQIAQQDPSNQQAMLKAFAETMKTGDLFADMQVKAALTAYMQNSALYANLKRDSKAASKDIEKDLADRRASAKQLWSEVGQAWDDAVRRVGDALQPLSDTVGRALRGIGQGIGTFASAVPQATAALAVLGASLIAWKGMKAGAQIGRGAFDLARGGLLAGRGRLPGRLGQLAERAGNAVGAANAQAVYVTNWPAGGLGSGGIDLPNRHTPGGTQPVGRMGRAWQAVRGAGERIVGGGLNLLGNAGRPGLALASMGSVASMAPTLGSIAGSGSAGLIATSGGMVAGAGAAGYGVGTLINKGVGKVTGGGDGWAGGGLFQQLHGEELRQLNAPISLAEVNALRAKQGKPAVTSLSTAQPASATKPVPTTNQQLTFAPNLAITVQGDVKDPRALAAELMPHLKRMFEDYRAQVARGALHDAAHV